MDMIRRIKASATVETLFLLPYATIFLLAIIWIIDLYHIHAVVGGTLNEVGMDLVAYSYPYKVLFNKGYDEKKTDDYLKSVLYTEGYVRQKISKTEIADKIEKLMFLSNFENASKDEISIKVSYFVRPYIAIPGIEGIWLANSFYSKMYVGYSKDETPQETEYVYVTKNSEVYHESDSCRGLKTTICEAKIGKIDELRNAEGGKYYKCNKCCKSVATGTVYITPYGIKYHANKECSDLKTNIYRVAKKEVEDRRLCKYCQKR